MQVNLFFFVYIIYYYIFNFIGAVRFLLRRDFNAAKSARNLFSFVLFEIDSGVMWVLFTLRSKIFDFNLLYQIKTVRIPLLLLLMKFCDISSSFTCKCFEYSTMRFSSKCFEMISFLVLRIYLYSFFLFVLCILYNFSVV